MQCTSCGQIIKPVVALDIDGTLGDYHGHLLAFMTGYFGRKMPGNWDGLGNWEDYLGLSRRDYQDAKLAFRQGGNKRTMPKYGGAGALSLQVTTLGAEVWITTTRPYNRLDSVDPDTKEWLRRSGVTYDHLLYDEDKYQRLAEIVGTDRVVAVLDDLPAQCQAADEVFGASKVLLRDNMHNQFEDRYERVYSLQQAGAAIERRIGEWNGAVVE